MKRILSLILLLSFFVLPQGVFAWTDISYTTQGPLTVGTVRGLVKDTPTEYIFGVKGSDKKFILVDTYLDSANPDKNRYFVLAYDSYGTRNFDTAGISIEYEDFNPTRTSNIGYYLNNDFKTSGQFPAGIIDYIDYDRVWKTEPLTTSHAVYEFTAGISLLSQCEFIAHAPKIGARDAITTWGWWLRTKRSSADNMLCVVNNSTNDTGGVNAQSSQTVRPAFYLKNDFFKNVAITFPADAIGISDVRKTINDNFTKADLAAANYTSEELNAIFAPFAPSARNVSISIIKGKNNKELTIAGEKLRAEYEYFDITRIPESGTKFAWYISDNATAGFTKIPGAEGREYLMTVDDIGMYIKSAVIPSNGFVDGNESISAEAEGIVLEPLSPYAMNAVPMGKPGVGKKITAQYDYTQQQGYPEADSVFEWYYCNEALPEGASGDSRIFTKIPGAASKDYIIAPEYLGSYIKFAVCPRGDMLFYGLGDPTESLVIGPVIERTLTTYQELKTADRTNLVELLKEFADVLDTRLLTMSENDLKTMALSLYPLLNGSADFADIRTKTINAINTTLAGSSGGTGGGRPVGGNSGNGGGGSIVIATPATPTPTPVEPDNKPTTEVETPGETPEIIEGTFSDLHQATWAEESIMYLHGKGFMGGMPDGKFAPNSRMLMVDFLKVVVDSFGYLDKDATATFVDITANRWMYPYAASAKNKGIINGIGNNVFGVHREVTREDMAAIIYRIAVDKKISLNNGDAIIFTDNDEISEYAVDAVSKLTQAGVINGFEDGSFLPKNYVTRAQAAKVVHKLLVLE